MSTLNSLTRVGEPSGSRTSFRLAEGAQLKQLHGRLKPPLPGISIIRLLAAVLLLSAAGACGYPPITPFQIALNSAWELERQWMYEEAAEAAQKAADIAGGNKEDRDNALIFKGKMLVRAKKYEEARACFIELHKIGATYAVRGRTLYELGLMEVFLGDRKKSLEWFLLLIKEYPEHGLCNLSLKRILRIVTKDEGEAAAEALLLELLPDALKTSFGDDVMWELAKMAKKKGDLSSAKKYCLTILQAYPYPIGGVAFDCYYMLSDIGREERNHEESIGWMKKMLDICEGTAFFGDFNSAIKVKAYIRMGRIYLEDMKQPEDAYESFMKGVKINWSTLSDNALWWAALARFAQDRNEDGCKLLERLQKDYAYSNFGRKAQKILDGEKCKNNL
ncbi:MAG: tetratricopeptide repeat protein [Pseudomonadota bacterium]